MYDARRQEPQGAFRSANGEVTWRVWAPFSPSVTLVTWPETGQTETDMNAVGDGCFACRLSQLPEGLRYAYRLADGHEYPDPASRWQLEGVHRPSAVFFPDAFAWSDKARHGIARQDLAIYELHVGTFTPEGTLAAIIPRLSGLRDLGVTALEIMPGAQFPGQRNGATTEYIPARSRGPQGLQALVNAAHEADLAVILDVVYNHLGNEGDYLGKFGPYFTHRYGLNAVWSDDFHHSDHALLTGQRDGYYEDFGEQIARWEGGLFLGYDVAHTLYLVLSETQPAMSGTFGTAMWAVVIPLTAITLILSLRGTLRSRRA